MYFKTYIESHVKEKTVNYGLLESVLVRGEFLSSVAIQ